MRFPCPMREHKFNNEYDAILCPFSLLLDCFGKEDQLFAAQYIWWLASIIQFTEILIYYRDYKVYTSDYVKNLVVTPLAENRKVSPKSEISVLDIEKDDSQGDPDYSSVL